MGELWDIYDSQKRKTGKIHEKGTPFKEGEYHIAVHAWIINDKNEILLTQRKFDDIFPGMWEPTAGSILAGETSLEGARRELEEELGIKMRQNDGKVIGGERRDQYHDFFDVCLFEKNINIDDIDIENSEVADVKWINKEEFDDMFEKGEVIQTLSYFKKLYSQIVKNRNERAKKPCNNFVTKKT
jgi:isopentenyldiphosphate isomerase